ncbi:MAG TPA: hypothetical protein VGE66_00905 [Chitinophagaceae bacterium]
MMNKQHTIIRWYTTALLLLGGAAATAQPGLPATVEAARTATGLQEKVYVHTDKSTYMAGEILWLKVYNVDALLHRPLDLSKVAYVDILDRANTPVAQVKIDLQGTAGGSIHLPLSLSSGNYRLRGYTSWMKNQGPQAYFEQVVTIINPLKNLEEKGTPSVPAYAATFFPEGGQMVQGLESRLAFKLTDRTGKGVEGSGVVVGPAGDTVASFATQRFGMGAFTLRPQPGQAYKAVMTTADGGQFTQALPAAAAQGYTFSLAEEGSGRLKLTVQSNDPGAASGPVYLLTHTRGVAKGTDRATLNEGTAVFSIDKKALAEGVSQFTLFDRNGQAVGERLYFKRPVTGFTLSAKSDGPQYAPRSKVSLAIQSSDPKGSVAQADLSLSVYRLDSLQDSSPADIASYLWLTSELKGVVESPGYYLSAATPEVEQATDLLLLTHGWRRLLPRQAPARASAPEYPLEYNGHLVRARIIDSRTGAPAAGVPAFLSVPGLHFRFHAAQSDPAGIVRFDVKDVYGASELVLQTNTPNESHYRFELLSPFSARFSTDSLPPFRLAAAPGLLEAHSIAMQAQNVYRGDSLRRFAAPALGDTLPFYGKGHYTYPLDEYTRFTTMEEVLREYVTPINVLLRGGKLHLRMLDEDRREFYEDNVLVLVDGVPLVDKNKIFEYDPHKVRRLDVIARGYLLGPYYFKGVASFTTYAGNLEGFALDPRVLMVNYEGLQLQREFYAPAYETPAQLASRIPDLRTTLLWKPDISTGDQGSTALSFYTSDGKGRYLGVLQGLDKEGRPAATTFTFTVR